MLEAFQSLREELTAKKQTEVDQTSLLASKPGTSSNSAVNLDLPPPRPSTNIQTEAMDVDYGPALPPRLVLDLYIIPRISMLLPLNYHRKRSRTHPKSKATPVVGRKLIRDLPRTNHLRNPMNLGSLLPNLKNTLIRVNTSQGPDMCHFLQGRISPLQPDTGLLSPLGLSPQGLFLIKTFHNMIQTPPIIGKYLCLTCPHSTLKRSTLLAVSFPFLTPGSLCLDL